MGLKILLIILVYVGKLKKTLPKVIRLISEFIWGLMQIICSP